MSKKCIKCGAELDDIAVFCDECGTKQIVQLTGTENKNTSSKVKQKKSSDSAQMICTQNTGHIFMN